MRGEKVFSLFICRPSARPHSLYNTPKSSVNATQPNEKMQIINCWWGRDGKMKSYIGSTWREAPPWHRLPPAHWLLCNICQCRWRLGQANCPTFSPAWRVRAGAALARHLTPDSQVECFTDGSDGVCSSIEAKAGHRSCTGATPDAWPPAAVLNTCQTPECSDWLFFKWPHCCCFSTASLFLISHFSPFCFP